MIGPRFCFALRFAYLFSSITNIDVNSFIYFLFILSADGVHCGLRCPPHTINIDSFTRFCGQRSYEKLFVLFSSLVSFTRGMVARRLIEFNLIYSI